MVFIRDRLDTFYTGLAGAQTTPLRTFMAKELASLTYWMRAADAVVGTPGTEVPSDTWTAPTVTTSMPPDVAVCISYRTDPPNTPRRRGRIYLGPLAYLTALQSSGGQIVSGARTDFAEAAKGLASDSILEPVKWVVASRVGNAAGEITNGHIDAGFDTQRRRDWAVVARTEWAL
jgi:hypothetical protein